MCVCVCVSVCECVSVCVCVCMSECGVCALISAQLLHISTSYRCWYVHT